MTRKTIVKFGALPSNPLTDDLDGWKVVSGSPTMKTFVQHTTEDGKVMSGTWQATPGTYHATYTDYEFVHLITGTHHHHPGRWRAGRGRRRATPSSWKPTSRARGRSSNP